MEWLSLSDWILLPVTLVLLYYYARLKRNRNIEEFPEFKFFIPGLTFKMIGALSLALIYALYYNGGDTINYYWDGLCLNKLLFSNPKAFFDVFFEGTNVGNYHYFTTETGYPVYYKDQQTLIITRISFLTTFIAFRSFIVSSIIFSWLSYTGIWRLYRVFLYEFPSLSKEMAVAVLFIPSVFFWGSGILKDSVTLSATGYFVFNFYIFFIRRSGNLWNIIGLFLTTYVILAIKPYIFFALLPGCLIWIINNLLSRFGGSFTKAAAAPVFIGIAIFSGYILLLFMSTQMGAYSIDNVLEKAVITQRDLKKDFYKGNTFEIGNFDATIPSMLSKTHVAINAALFRPYLWETKNVVMFMSGIENFIILLVTLKILFQLRIFGVFRYFFKHHLLTFSLIFSLFFSFSVGLTTPNFGSMVRYRIPILPFYVASLYMIRHFYLIEQKEKKTKKNYGELSLA